MHAALFSVHFRLVFSPLMQLITPQQQQADVLGSFDSRGRVHFHFHQSPLRVRFSLHIILNFVRAEHFTHTTQISDRPYVLG